MAEGRARAGTNAEKKEKEEAVNQKGGPEAKVSVKYNVVNFLGF